MRLVMLNIAAGKCFVVLIITLASYHLEIELFLAFLLCFLDCSLNIYLLCLLPPGKFDSWMLGACQKSPQHNSNKTIYLLLFIPFFSHPLRFLFLSLFVCS